ncbi:MAG: response regulator transcription factor [Anaerolineae bacterium]|nr:response regulator transcription factor [Anaerolineae bacterium]
MISERISLDEHYRRFNKSRRQRFGIVAQGRRNAEIAKELYISVRTVESHHHRIFKKLRISSQTEAAIYTFESGLFLKPEFSGRMFAVPTSAHRTSVLET